MSKTVYSAIRTPDGTVLHSSHVHDYVHHIDANGETYVLDGGLAYTRTSVNNIPAENISLTTDDPHEEIRKVIKWGSYGRGGKGPLNKIPVKDMSNEHIVAVTKLPYTHPNILIVLHNELDYREERNIFIPN